MECWSIALVIHPELGVMPLQIQQLNYHDVLILFGSEVDVEWVAQKLLRMEWWMGASCNLECIPCSNKEGASTVQGRGISGPKGRFRVDRSIKVGSNSPHRIMKVAPFL